MNVHTSKYKCSECGKCFQYNADLMRHSLIHSQEKPNLNTFYYIFDNLCLKTFCSKPSCSYHNTNLTYPSEPAQSLGVKKTLV